MIRGTSSLLVAAALCTTALTESSFGQSGQENPGGCQADCGKLNIECLNPSPQYDNRTVVCRILNNGSGWCTGWIIASDGVESVIMTNEHCTVGQNVTNFTVEFNRECDSCVGSCRPRRRQ